MKKIALFLAACAAFFSCSPKNGITLFPEADFAAEVDGKQVGLYTLQAGDITMQTHLQSASIESCQRNVSCIKKDEQKMAKGQ